jgi:hypothetical protein
MRCVAFSLLFLFLSTSSVGICADTDAIRQELVKLELDYCAAQISRNAQFLADVLAEDYTQIGSRGSLQGKADVLRSLQDRSSSVASCAQSNVRVRVYGAAAVVTGQTNAAGTHQGIAFAGRRVLWTDTFIHIDGRWRLVATQSTAMAPS